MMHKDKDEIKRKIVKMISESNPKIISMCAKAGITDATYRNWRKEDPTFDKECDEAKEKYLRSLSLESKKSLGKLVKGYDYEETKTVYVPGINPDEPMIAQQIVQKKHVPPNIQAIIFVLTNTDIEDFEK